MKFKSNFLALCGISILPMFIQEVVAYDLHEWGTFTTVSGSDGGVLKGLHVEEEQLPDFVYSHKGMRPSVQSNRLSRGIFVRKDAKGMLIQSRGKGMSSAKLKNVTVKMETPVIYFYGDDTPKVNVKVGFNGGTISQWYPDRTAGDTPNLVIASEHKISEDVKGRLDKGRLDKHKISELKKWLDQYESIKYGPKEWFGENELIMHEPIDFSKPYNGFIEWDVDILPKSEADPAFTFKANESHSWIYPRVPEANMIRVGEEYEDYLFYRGIGNFEVPASFSVDSSETLHVKNNSKEAIPFAFAFENVGGKFRYKAIGKISAESAVSVAESDWVTPTVNEQQVAVFQQMRDGLVAQGLTMNEANGMLKTWWKSYFGKDGLRVFWVVPSIDVERILPLTVTPKPENQVRVLVGRADVLRPEFEQRMIAELGTHQFKKYMSDRFYGPYRQRLTQLITDPVFQKFDERNITNVPLKITAVKGTSKLGESLYLANEREVKLQHLKLNGEWEIVGDQQLKIGDVLFTLDLENGKLSSKESLDDNYEKYEIQLPRVLN